MKIAIAKPPIWAEAHKHFDIDDQRTIYTWGDTIYNPAGVDIGRELVEHESVHEKQQAAMGGPDKWWKKYFEDPQFRMEQEAEAYGRQYAYYCFVQHNRDMRFKYLYLYLAKVFAGGTYKAGISHQEAMTLIKKHALAHKDFKK